MNNPTDDKQYMTLALRQAHEAGQRGEVPIGAIIVYGERVVASAHNLTQALTDPTAHAEMQAVTAACDTIGGKYLKGCTLYVTLEPCPMCAAALRWAQIDRIVWGASDPKGGFLRISSELLHPKTTTHSGVCEEECAEVLKKFFSSKR